MYKRKIFLGRKRQKRYFGKVLHKRQALGIHYGELYLCDAHARRNGAPPAANLNIVLDKRKKHLLESVRFQPSFNATNFRSYIFARNCYETGLMNKTEWSIYTDWSTYLLESLGDLQLDGFIYLRCNPKVCENRMVKRGRLEEKDVTLDYLSQIHEKHEQWLHSRKFQ